MFVIVTALYQTVNIETPSIIDECLNLSNDDTNPDNFSAIFTNHMKVCCKELIEHANKFKLQEVINSCEILCSDTDIITKTSYFANIEKMLQQNTI